MEALNRKIEVVSETNFVRTIVMRLETPKYDEAKGYSGWHMSEAGQIHMMPNSDNRYCVAVFKEDGTPHHSNKRGLNILYFQSRQDAIQLFDKAVLFWESQKAIEDLGLAEAKNWMRKKTQDKDGWGGTSELPRNPFEW